MCQQAIQRFVGRLGLCLLVELAACFKAVGPGVSCSIVVEDPTLVCEPPALGLEVLTAPVFLCKLVVVGACRFHQCPLSCFCVRQIYLGVVASVRSRIRAPQLYRRFNNSVLLLKRRRLATSVHSVSGSAFTVSDSGRIEDDLVPLEDDPPVRSVSPASAIVGLSSVGFGGLPRRTRPCPSWQPHTLTRRKSADSSCNLSTILSDNDVCVVFVQSCTPETLHLRKLFCSDLCVRCEEAEHGTVPIH